MYRPGKGPASNRNQVLVLRRVIGWFTIDCIPCKLAYSYFKSIMDNKIRALKAQFTLGNAEKI